MHEKLTDRVKNVLKNEYGIDEGDVSWQRPQDSSHGDIASPVALQIAKKASKSPQEIAQSIVDAVDDLDEVEKTEVAGAGYVNVFLTSSALLQSLKISLQEAEPQKVRSDEAPVIVEYSQPNIAKPLGAHHLLTTLFGQSIANLYEHAGYKVVKWNYMGDWGTQFGKLYIAVTTWGDGRNPLKYTVDELLDFYVRFHSEAESDSSLDEKAREAFLKLEQKDADLRAFWEAVMTVTKNSLGSIYKRLHVSFDTDISESFYEDKMAPHIDDGIQKGIFAEGKEGALIVNFSEKTGFPPYLIRKADGATLYSTRDIAQMRYRMDEYQPQSILIVTDIAQQLHFQQLEATCTMLGWQLPHFENVLVGRMRFADKSMSTRKGNVLKLSALLDEAVTKAREKIAHHSEDVQSDDVDALAEMMGAGSVAYSILSQNRRMDIVFDLEKALSFEGNSAPYLQYTHARTRSVLRKTGAESGNALPADIDALTDPERLLVNSLMQFPHVLEEARVSHMPHVLTNYLFSLCQDFNAFYNTERILDAGEPHRALRLALTEQTASVLQTGAELLTLRVPDRM